MEIEYFIDLAEAIVVTILAGIVGIPLLKKLKARQSIRLEGPKSHRAKSGTPTMGGLFMLFALVVVVVFNQMIDPSVLWLLFLTLGHGLLGFLDDFIKAEKKKESGPYSEAKNAWTDYFSSSFLLGRSGYVTSALFHCYSIYTN